MTNVLIFGVGDISQIASYYLDADERYNVTAFVLDREYIQTERFEGRPVIDFATVSDFYPPEDYKFFVPLSYTDLNDIREKKYLEVKEKGYTCISYVSPNAFIASNSSVGENCFIFEDNTVQPFVVIEDNCILWSGNHIGHHSTVEKNCFISSHVVIAGGCTIGRNSFLGVNSTLRDHITIGEYNIIGAGSLILKSTNDFDVYVGSATPLFKKTSRDVSL
jgi:sugar O-acyltransferase (sialic acid O-acetyltransferase NeuD family)